MSAVLATGFDDAVTVELPRGPANIAISKSRIFGLLRISVAINVDGQRGLAFLSSEMRACRLARDAQGVVLLVGSGGSINLHADEEFRVAQALGIPTAGAAE